MRRLRRNRPRNALFGVRSCILAHYALSTAKGNKMTEQQAISILSRVRAGDKTPTIAEINLALVVSGDITSLLSPMILEIT